MLGSDEAWKGEASDGDALALELELKEDGKDG
jgi:hypothetical protein